MLGGWAITAYELFKTTRKKNHKTYMVVLWHTRNLIEKDWSCTETKYYSKAQNQQWNLGVLQIGSLERESEKRK